jgi:hypothetical protein
VFVNDKPFQPSLSFAGKARCLPYSGAPEKFFDRLGPCFTNRQTRLERLAMDKHSSLLQKLVNYDRKKFITLGPGSGIINYLAIVNNFEP